MQPNGRVALSANENNGNVEIVPEAKGKMNGHDVEPIPFNKKIKIIAILASTIIASFGCFLAVPFLEATALVAVVLGGIAFAAIAGIYAAVNPDARTLLSQAPVLGKKEGDAAAKPAEDAAAKPAQNAAVKPAQDAVAKPAQDAAAKPPANAN